MKFQTICIFAAILTSAIVSADLSAAKHKIIDSVIGEEAKNMNAECFNQLKTELTIELEAAMEKFVDRIENNMPVFKKGVFFHLGPYINDVLLPKALVAVDSECLQHTKEVLSNIIMKRFGDLLSEMKFL